MKETVIDRAYAKSILPPRKADGHKGSFGKLLILGGSVGYTGAPYLAASAAVHSGAGRKRNGSSMRSCGRRGSRWCWMPTG